MTFNPITPGTTHWDEPVNDAFQDLQDQQTGHVSGLDPHGDRASAAALYVPLTDGRLSDPRSPLPHASTHATGGSDQIAPSDIGALAVSSLSSSASDYVPAASSPSAGVSTHPARADHVHPMRGDAPEDQGLLDWSYDPQLASASIGIVQATFAGRLLIRRQMVRKTYTWSNLLFGLASVDTGSAVTSAYWAVYDSTGALRAQSADQSALLGSHNTADGTWHTVPWVTPFTATPGAYYVALVMAGTWGSGLTLKGTSGGSSTNANINSGPFRFGFYGSAGTYTTPPSSITLSAMSATGLGAGICSWWIGAS